MKIMFICTGNICRSAMAHRLLEKRLKDINNTEIEVYSCGIYAENGDGSTYNAINVMKDYNVDLQTHRATNIKQSKIEEMDLILCATNAHKQEVIYMYPELKNKVLTMKEYVNNTTSDLDIKDPWGYDSYIYARCAEEINEVIDTIINNLARKEE